MNQVSLEGRSIFGIGTVGVALLAMLFAWPGGASAAQPYTASGTVNACYKAKGKEKGALRLVKNARKCKRMRGWRAVSWAAVGPSGAPGPADSGSSAGGSAGPSGPVGPKGDAGSPGSPGVVGELEQSLLDTIQDQSDQIAALTAQVNGLTGDLVDLEGVVGLLGGDLLGVEGLVTGLTGDVGDVEGLVTGLTGDVTDLEGAVGDACDQVDLLTEQSDELLDVIGGLSIIGGLVDLFIPSLPDPLGTFEGCTA